MSKIRRINYICGAGAGKSVLANYTRAILSFKGYNIELVSQLPTDKICGLES
ncbi:hypothetical protein LCGC14_2624420 [marine sediment metagenome]|uniref:Uncharacterized protein n=1 Tax=marine sediment metagenome TaxID=412755 RepID=A0A0F9CD46_9ZZZZ